MQYRQSRPDANSLVDTATKKSDDGQTTCSTETFAIRFSGFSVFVDGYNVAMSMEPY